MFPLDQISNVVVNLSRYLKLFGREIDIDRGHNGTITLCVASGGKNPFTNDRPIRLYIKPACRTAILAGNK